MEYKQAPSNSYVKKLKWLECEFTSTKMKDALTKAFADLGLPIDMIHIVADPVPETMPDKDPQTLFIRYKLLYESHPYLADEVKMEFSVRSLKEPFAKILIQSIASEAFPNPAYEEPPFGIVALEPRKTLLEKAFLLHEKLSFNYQDAIRGDRQTRHFHDLVQLMETPAGVAAIDDQELYTAIVEHRRYYARINGVNYDNMLPKKLNFVPSIVLFEYFENDYLEMQRSMIYGESHPFAELIQRLKIFNGRVRLTGTGLRGSLHSLTECYEQ